MKEKNDLKKSAVLKANEFFSGGEKNPLFEEVTSEIINDENKKFFDRVRIKRDKDWSEVGHKIVGSE